MDFSFKKSERIYKRDDINNLFQSGKEIFVYPFKVKFQIINSDEILNKVLISIPKKKFKKAVTRNNIKRKIREAYRLNKHSLKSSENTIFHIALIYIGDPDPDTKFLIRKMKKLNEKILLSLDTANN